MNGSAAEAIGAWTAGFQLGDAPPEVVEATVTALVNAAGATIGALELPNVQRAIRLAKREGGGGAALIFGDGARVAPTYALLANGTMANCLGHEETHVASGQHPVTTTLPVALATAEAHERSGEELLAALLAGAEVAMNVARAELVPAFIYERCQAPAVYGTIGAAAAAAKLAGLDADGIARAVALAANMASGLSHCFRAGTSEYHFNVGHLSAHAHLAAALAAEDAEAAPCTLEGDGGFYHLFASVDGERLAAHDLAADVGARLGVQWGMPELIYKPYPVHFFNQPFADAARTLRERHGVAPDDVRRVRIEMGPVAAASGGVATGPFTSRTGLVGSTPFVVGAMLARGRVGLEETTPREDGTLDDVLALVARSEVRVAEEGSPVVVEVETADGAVAVDAAAEGRDYRLSRAEVEQIALGAAANVLDADAAQELVAQLADVRALDRVEPLADLLTAPARTR